MSLKEIQNHAVKNYIYGLNQMHVHQKQFKRIAQSVRDIINNSSDSNVNVYFYGSRVFGLATENSDLDIFCELGENILLFLVITLNLSQLYLYTYYQMIRIGIQSVGKNVLF